MVRSGLYGVDTPGRLQRVRKWLKGLRPAIVALVVRRLRDALQLETAGVVARASQGQRNRTWEATGLLDLLADLEAGVAVPPLPE